MITAASFPADLNTWGQNQHPYYLEVFIGRRRLSSKEVTVPAAHSHGVMHGGVVWAIPKEMCELLGGRPNGSVAVSSSRPGHRTRTSAASSH